MRVFHYKCGKKCNALERVKILDLTRIVAGPLCTMILGDLGAQIYKVEHPNGDDARTFGPYGRDPNFSFYFASLNRNKKSLCVNFKSKQGQEIIRQLASKCDVLVENFVPNTLKKYGLDYNSLKNFNPGLIYCSITGFGCNGPYAEKSCVDLVASAMSGLLHLTGPSDGEPCKPGVPMTDIMTGLYAHGAILTALYHKFQCGEGQLIECNLLHTAVASLINVGTSFLNKGLEGKRLGTRHSNIAPYEAFPTSDGYFVIGAINDIQFEEFCAKLGIKELQNKFPKNEDRVKNLGQLKNALLPIFATKTTAEWIDIFKESSFPHGPLNDIPRVFNDVHVASNMVEEVDQETEGLIKLLKPVVRYSHLENQIQFPPPNLGQHTDQVLRELLNYQPEHIEFLKQNRIIK